MDSWDFLEFLGFLGNETPPKTAKRNNGFGVFWHFLTFFVLFWEKSPIWSRSEFEVSLTNVNSGSTMNQHGIYIR
jgi:hypothetical protein